MDVKSETIEISDESTLADLFKLYAERALPDAPANKYLATKNAFYMGLNAALTLLHSSKDSEALFDRLKQLEIEFEVYHANLVGRN